MAGTKTGTWIRGIAGMAALRQLSKMSGNKKLPLKRRLLLAGLVFAAGRMQAQKAADGKMIQDGKMAAGSKAAAHSKMPADSKASAQSKIYATGEMSAEGDQHMQPEVSGGRAGRGASLEAAAIGRGALRGQAAGALARGDKKRRKGWGSRSHPFLTAAKLTYKILDTF